MNDRTDRPVRRLEDDGYVAEQRRPVMRRAEPREIEDHEQAEYEPGTFDRASVAHQQPRGATSPAAVVAAQGRPAARRDEDDEDENVVVFSKVYKNQDDDVRQVRLKKPTPASLRRIGYPARTIVDPGTGEVQGLDMLPDRLARYIYELSEPQLLPSTIDRMEFEDFEACAGRVMSFFRR